MAIFDSIQALIKKKDSRSDELDITQSSEQDIARLAAERLAPASGEDGYAESQLLTTNEEHMAKAGLVDIPLLGRKSAAQHQRTLTLMLGAGILVLGGTTLYVLSQTDKVSQQVAATGQALMQSQRLAKSVSQALVGSPSAFPEVRESSDVLARTARGLKNGDDQLGIAALGGGLVVTLDEVLPKAEQAEANAKAVLAQEKILTQVGDALRTINRQSSDLLEIAETVSSLKLQQNAAASELSAAGQLVMLTQRIGKSANEFLTMEGVSPEAVFLLGKDLNTFKEVAEGLLKGSEELRLSPARDEQVKERL
ncbi:MAG: twitching motility protein PilJ, partial [Betaproteobacteria bacterium]|nr:twitching motility protein PilJ [Betaproteobacteria bacterium]